jgi:hypothetical protein
MTDTTWFIPAKVIQLADGSCLVKPGKAIQRAKAAQCAKLTGVHRKTIAALADCGLIRRSSPSPSGAFYYPAEIEDLIARTEEDPAFWTTIRTRAYLTGSKLKHSKPSG